jgi:nuclear transport factor 2 (NTF2) superfamily protein
VKSPEEQAIRAAYDAFNARDIDEAVGLMNPDVAWPNGLEGGYLHGRAAVEEYWERQWASIAPSVTPLEIRQEADGRFAVTVHQVVRDLQGSVQSDREIEHVYRFANGLITHMEIRQPS